MTDKPTRGETKAARLMILAMLDAAGHLAGCSDAELGHALSVRRETAWRYRRALAATRDEYERIKLKLYNP